MKTPQQYEPFDPETVAILGRAFDAAWKAAEESGLALISPASTQDGREMLALRIIHLAQQGVRDCAKLQNEALAFVTRRTLAGGSGEPLFPSPII
jgi:hypothetical protein